MSKRRSLSKRLRFAVLERDGFACRYCGASAPDVQLHIDHHKPVSRGGTNDAENLVTACADCNLGKHAFLPQRIIPAQRAVAYATVIFGRACERFGVEAFTWDAFCQIQDFCYMEEEPENILGIVRDSATWADAKQAMYRYSGFPAGDDE